MRNGGPGHRGYIIILHIAERPTHLGDEASSLLPALPSSGRSLAPNFPSIWAVRTNDLADYVWRC